MSDYTGTSGPDEHDGTEDPETLSGLQGNDILRGRGGDDIVHGNEDDDLLDGDGITGLDPESGGTPVFDSGDDMVFGDDGNDRVFGGEGNDELDGGIGNDQLYGDRSFELASGFFFIPLQGTSAANGTSDTLVGGAGSDSLYSDYGPDTIDGGADRDRAEIDRSESTVALTADFSAGPSVETVLSDGTTVINVEDVYVFGGSGADSIIGGAGDDSIDGNGEDDTLDSGTGDDILNGGTGADILYGGIGNDTYVLDVGDKASETGGDGTDTVEAAISYQLRAGFEDLLLTGTATEGSGNAAANGITGNDEANLLKGFEGDDSLQGGRGSDTLEGGIGGDELDGFFVGFDIASYASASKAVTADLMNSTANFGEARGDTYISIEGLTGSAFNDFLRGDNNANVVWGLAGNDDILGRGGHDILIGGEGADALNGGASFDILTGGAGNDSFDFHIGEAAGDSVVDFDGLGAGPGDTFVFHGYGTSAQGATFTQTDATHWVIHSNAFGGVNETITLAAGTTVHEFDILFV